MWVVPEGLQFKFQLLQPQSSIQAENLTPGVSDLLVSLGQALNTLQHVIIKKKISECFK